MSILNTARSVLSSTPFLSAAILTTIIIRFILILPVSYWGWDERSYLVEAQSYWLGLKDAMILKNGLYALLISPAFAFGDQYFTVMKLLNLGIVSAGLGILYWGFRSALSIPSALTAVFLCAVMGMFSITGHAMTEPLLFAAYALFWSAIARFLMAPPHWSSFALFGLSLPIMAASSPKFLPIAGLVLIALALGLALHRKTFVSALNVRHVLIALAASLGGYGLLQLVLASPDSGAYDGLKAIITLPNLSATLSDHPKEAFDTVIGHIAVNGLFFVLPLAFTLMAMWRGVRDKSRDWVLPAVTLAGMGAALGLCLIFQFTMATQSPIISTLFFRYHFYAWLPLLLWLFLTPAKTLTRKEGVFTFILTALFIIGAWYTLHSGHSTVYPNGGIETSEAWGHHHKNLHILLLVGLMISAGLFALNRPTTARFLFIIIFSINGAMGSIRMAQEIGMINFDRCAGLKLAVPDATRPIIVAARDRTIREHIAIAPPLSRDLRDETLVETLVAAKGDIAALDLNPDVPSYFLLRDDAADGWTSTSIVARLPGCVVYDVKAAENHD